MDLAALNHHHDWLHHHDHYALGHHHGVLGVDCFSELKEYSPHSFQLNS
jgi:hypothetical protein